MHKNMIDRETLKMEWKNAIEMLDIRKEEWNRVVKNKSSLFKFLKKNIYHDNK
jgi:heme oxygenase